MAAIFMKITFDLEEISKFAATAKDAQYQELHFEL